MPNGYRRLVGIEPEHVETMMVVSTGHVTEETAAALNDGADGLEWVICYPFEYGWMVTADSELADDSDASEAIPADLRKVLDLAERNGCRWVRFDCDARLVGGLDFYNW